MAGYHATSGAAKVAIIAATSVVLMGLAVMVGLRLTAPKPKDPPQPKLDAIVYPIGSFVVNLNPADGFRFLKITVALEITGAMGKEKLKEQAAANKYRWSDTLVRHLSGRTYTEVSSSDGRQRTEQDLLTRLNQGASGLVVEAVYFSEFVAQ